MADTGTPPAAVAAKRATKRRNLRKRPADDGEGAADAGAAAALDDARALARLRERKTGLSADTLLSLAARSKTAADTLLAEPAVAAGGDTGAGSLAGAYVRETAADAAAAATAADADAYVEAELARRLGLPPPERAAAAQPGDSWRGEREALYAIPDELRGQVSKVGPDAGAAGGAAVAEVPLSADAAAANVERTEAAKRALLGLAPVAVADPVAERRAAEAAARAALPRSFGARGGGRGRGRGRRD